MRCWNVLFAFTFWLNAAPVFASVFEPAAGSDPGYVARGQGYRFEVKANSFTVHLGSQSVSSTFLGASDKANVAGLEPLASHSTYLVGDKAGWRTRVPHYARVLVKNPYPGIDIEYHWNEGRVEFDVIAAPWADASQVRLRFCSAPRLREDGTIELVAGRVRLRRPAVYQTLNNERRPIASRWSTKGREARFVLAAYDRSAPLVIDPVIEWATFYGGSGNEQADAIAVDAAGNVYIAGATSSTNLPLQNARQRNSAGGGTDAYVAKVSSDGKTLLWATYLGGARAEQARGIAVDAGGNVYVSGATDSEDFPVTAGVARSEAPTPGRPQVFVVKFDPAGANLLYSTLIGGPGTDISRRLRVDAQGNAFVSGLAEAGFPTTTGAFQSIHGGQFDAFVLKLSPPADRILFSTLFGANGTEEPTDLEIAPTGQIVIGGWSSSTTPGFTGTENAFQKQRSGPTDGFVAMFSADGATMPYMSFIGGSAAEQARGISLGLNGNVWVAGGTTSRDLPTTAGAPNREFLGGPSDGFLARLPLPLARGADPADQPLLTYIGDSRQNFGLDVLLARAPEGSMNPTAAASETPGVGQEISLNGLLLYYSLSNVADTLENIASCPTPVMGTFGTLYALNAASLQLLQGQCVPRADIGEQVDLRPGTIAGSGVGLSGAQTSPGAMQPDFGGGVGTLPSDGFAVVVRFFDSGQPDPVRPLEITTPARLADGFAGENYTADLAASGGVGTYNWSFAGISPPGMRIDPATGRMSGLVDRPGQYVFGIQVADSAKTTANKQFSLVMSGPAGIDVSAFSPTNFFEGIDSADLNGANPANPDIAVGPDDILTVVGNRIARYPNPNAPGGPGFAPGPLNPSVGVASEGTSLEAWVGEEALNRLCPTMPRTDESCVFGNAAIRYDQMHGRFVLLFTVVDTIWRKASWYLALSRSASVSMVEPVFSTPVPGGSEPSDTTNWFAWYDSGQGFGGAESDLPGFGSINALPGLPGSGSRFNCKPDAVAPGQQTNVCYFPTAARLGIDNNNIVIASPVFNANIASPDSSTPAYAGTRVRVIKKAGIYQEGSNLIAGNQFADNPEDRGAGGFYDLFTNDGVGTPLTGTPFTVVDPQSPTAAVFYEPAHLRGRTMLSSSGFPFVRTTYLIGALSSAAPQRNLYVQTIGFQSTGPGPFSYCPFLGTEGVDPADPNAGAGVPKLIVVPAFTNPAAVTQSGADPARPRLYVGDARPHRVISREGHRYVARVGSDPARAGQSTTVIFDILRSNGEILNSRWHGVNAYAPMFDVPASVVGTGSPAEFPWLEKLFVGTTNPPLTNIPAQGDRAPAPGGDPRYQYRETGGLIKGLNGVDACAGPSSTPAWAGLFDIRCGEESYETVSQYRNPVTGAVEPLVPFGLRGGASTDPNDASLWVYGQYSLARLVDSNLSRWGTFGANSPLTFQVGRDFSDVTPSHPLYRFIQIANQVGLATADPAIGENSFAPDSTVTRSDMARFIVRAQMDESAVTDYLAATGGESSSFSDVAQDSPDWKYIETMYRRGYTKGCGAGSDGTRTYCLDRNLTRGEMAVFIIRAKLNNVFPVGLNACSEGSVTECPERDNFGAFTVRNPYFSDVPADNPFFRYVQKMRELGISNGTSLELGADGTFLPDDPVKRGQLMVFLVRAFFL